MAEPPFELCDAKFKFWWTAAASAGPSRRGGGGSSSSRRRGEEEEERRMETEVDMTFARISGGDFAEALTGGLDADFF